MQPLKLSLTRLAFLCLFVSAIPVGICAQNNANTANVNDLRREYGAKSDVVCLKSSETYTFEYDTKNSDGKIIAKDEKEEQYMSLGNGVSFTIPLYYDENTDMDGIKVYDNKGHTTDAYIADVSTETRYGNNLYEGGRVKYFNLDFNLPGDKAGYKGNKYYSNPRYLTRVFFVKSEPTLERDIIVSIPKWMNIELKEMNFAGYDIQKTISTDPKTGNTVYTYTGKKLKTATFNAENAPAAGYMYPHIIFLCKSYTDYKGTHNLISSLDDMYAWMHQLVIDAGNNNTTLKPVVSDIIKGKTTDVDKVKAIYYWVQDNIRYLAVENGIAGQQPDPCQNVLQKRYGDCKGMANLMVEMLKIAGFDARRVWLGTKQLRGYDYSIPSLCVGNHCICAVLLNNKYYFLDGTQQYAAFDDNADWIQGRQVLIENGDKYILQTIPVAPIERSKIIINTTTTLAPNDILSGDEHAICNGESKTYWLDRYHHTPSDQKNLALNYMVQGNDQDVTATNIVSSDIENREIPVKFSFNYSFKNQVSDFDKDTYVTVDPQKWIESLVFDSTRTCDYEFDYRLNKVFNDTLLVPAGYTVKHVPDNINITTPDYVFKVTVSQSGNKIIYHKEVQILNEIIDIKNFDKWNADVTQLKKITDDQVVLTKN